MGNSLKARKDDDLFHFKGVFRVIVLCIKAALKHAFGSESSSPYLASLNKSKKDKASHLLFSHQGNVGSVGSEADIQDHHILTYIKQIDGHDLQSQVLWHRSFIPLSCWVDPASNHAAQYFFLVVSQAFKNKGCVNLSQLIPWGSHQESFQGSTRKKRKQWLQKVLKGFQTYNPTVVVIEGLLDAGENYFDRLDSVSLSFDGNISRLILEGSFKKQELHGMVLQLRTLPSPIIVINANERNQLGFIMSSNCKSNSLEAFLVIGKPTKSPAEMFEHLDNSP